MGIFDFFKIKKYKTEIENLTNEKNDLINQLKK